MNSELMLASYSKKNVHENRPVFSAKQFRIFCGLILAVAWGIGATPTKARADNDLVLVRDGRPNAAIVIPAGEHEGSEHFVTARLLQDYIKAHTGAQLPILCEGKAPVATEAVISLGMTGLAKTSGLDPAMLTSSCGYIKRIGNTLFILGRDVSKQQVFSAYKDPEMFQIMGTRRTMVLFMRDVLGYRFFYPGTAGAYFPPGNTIALGNVNILTKKPAIPLHSNGWSGTDDMVYRISLGGGVNHEFYQSYGGHSFYAWVPEKEYFPKHPDWFCMEKGVRAGRGNYICPTSAELKAHIVECMKKVVDAGFDMMQYNFADATNLHPCECPRCAAEMARLKISDHEELLRIFARDCCLELKKTRPQATVVLVIYGPLAGKPLTFDRYPDNVLAEVVTGGSDPAQPKVERWKDAVKGLFIYDNGWWLGNTLAMAGQQNLFDMADYARLYLKLGVKMIHAGGPINIPVEDPSGYIAARILENPQLTAEEVLDDLCRKMFGPAAEPMNAFYQLAHRCIQRGDRVYNKSGAQLDRYLPFLIEWPIADLTMLQTHLDKAKLLAPDDKTRRLIAWVQDGFDIKDVTSRLVQVYLGYLAEPDMAKLDAVEKMVRKREAVVKRIFANKNPGFNPVLYRHSMDEVLKGGKDSGVQLPSPLAWDFETFKKENFLIGKDRVQTVVNKTETPPKIDAMMNDPAWQKATAFPLRSLTGGKTVIQTDVRLLYDETNIYVFIDAKEPLIEKLETQKYGRDGLFYRKEHCEVFFDPMCLGRVCYQFMVAPQEGALWDAKVLNAGEKYDTDWNSSGSWAYKRDNEAKAWRVEMAIPFADLGLATPKDGDFWLGNFMRNTQAASFDLKRGKDYDLCDAERNKYRFNAWSPIVGSIKYADPNSMGKIWFGKAQERSR